MPKIKVLPHADICPQGVEFESPKGAILIEELFKHAIKIEHACEMQCACTTCQVYVRTGFDSLNEAQDKENDLLDRAWGVDMDSRLSCQVIIDDEDLVVEIPKYTINMVSEG
ncbi:MAG: ISC system 2Fe-2S type ferredoxin [Gammaproteobacteria bacterium CG11_big_fil_rev_8_21_14_0_20_46_22]|nr:MAG: ISC system 2Fe-2S type ferredoxin [Gammaproteobacteria bacterium CG12_big_fil_rev_8_21_14_0_65_46_12]PIR11743.1 MAG: ISC system 2Fe-2S type ferredoxin [Gammaproteobacteria bacterium CG11_big_fil_rev_8_21_14_0_20_46_22]